MRFLLCCLSLFISVGLQAGIIKVINNSDQPIFVTAQKFGCGKICYTDQIGFSISHNKTHLCCLDKKQGLSSQIGSKIIAGGSKVMEGVGTALEVAGTVASGTRGVYYPYSPPPRQKDGYSPKQFAVPGWYILPGQSEEEDFSRNNYTFYVYQQDSDTEWVNEEVNQGMILSFPEDFTQN